MMTFKRTSNGVLASAALALAAATGAIVTSQPSHADSGPAEAAPTLMHRLTEAQYRNIIADVFGPDIEVVGRFDPDLRVDGLLAVGAGQVSVTPSGLEQYEEIARGIAAQVTDEAHRDDVIGCAPSAGDADGARCAEAFFEKIGLRLYRRPIAPAEVRELSALAVAASRQLDDYDAGIAAALAAVLTSPQFLFRIDAPGTNGEVDEYSKASRLSFLFWNTAPDEILLAAARDGRLNSAEGLAEQIDRLVASPRFVEGVRAYFSDFLHLDAMETLSKDSQIYPSFTPVVAEAAREQTLRTVTDLLVVREGDFRELFTTRRFAMNATLGPVYDIPVARSGWYLHEFPNGDPRVGLLTQASLLALHSHPGRTSPTLRGMAVQEALLCTKVPAPPASVNFAVVQDVDNEVLKTTRSRLQAHLDDEECATCHRVTDPVGLGLEQFDGAGQFRTVENGEAIDVTGDFDDKPFDGAAELGQIFHDSTRVSACFVNTAWRYANGRQALAADKAVIERLTEGFAAHGYRLAPLLKAIALDPSFFSLGERPPAEPAHQAKGAPTQERRKS